MSKFSYFLGGIQLQIVGIWIANIWIAETSEFILLSYEGYFYEWEHVINNFVIQAMSWIMYFKFAIQAMNWITNHSTSKLF